MHDPPLSFGYWLRRRRKALDLTQEQLADAACCSRYTIRKIEADERRPSRGLAERLARHLQVPAHEVQGFFAAARAARSLDRLAVDHRPLDHRPLDHGPPDRQPPQFQAPPAPGEDVAPELVGRDDERARLRRLLDQARAGAGQVVVIEGEPGIGKSRLLQALLGQAAALGLSTFQTRCYEIERSMPYQPVIDLATQAVERAGADTLRRLAPLSLAEIAALVPQVAEQAPVAPVSADFPEARQSRLFRALVQLFDAVSAGGAAVLALDDLQWADESSAQFVHFLARQAVRRPMLLALTVRDDDLGSDERLAALVAGLHRDAPAHAMRLHRLGRAEMQPLLRGLEPALAQRLQQETDGNPFYLVSMLQALREGPMPQGDPAAVSLPQALLASVRARLAHVPAQARPVLDAAAVLGRHFEFDTLLAVVGGPESQLLQALDLLVARRVLCEEPRDGSYDFAHDKLREVALRDIGSGRRILLHRSVAAALAGDSDARLAEHCERGQLWAQALQHMVRAARASLALFAMRDALRWFDRAVALAQEHPDARGTTDLISLVEERGTARAQAGLTAGAVDDFARVIGAARASDDRARLRDALILLGMAHRRADDYARATAALNEALQECRAMHDERHAADTLYHLGTVAWSDGRNGEAIACHEQAVAICERLRLEDIVAVQAWHGRGEAHFNHLEPHAAIACYLRSIDLARSLGDKGYEAENLMMVGYACVGDMGLGDYPKAEAHFQQALAMARAADLQWHMGPTLLGLDHVRACTGRYGEAWTGMCDTLRWLQGVHHVRYQLMAHDFMGQLLVELGRDEQAAGLLEDALVLARDARVRFWQPRIQADLAIASLRLGRLEAAGRLLEEAHGEARRQRERMHLARCLEGLAQLALARGEAEAALRPADELLADALAGGLEEHEAAARRWRAEALAALGRRDDAVAEFAAAAQAAEALGRVRLAFDAACGLARLGAAGGAKARMLARRLHASVAGTGLDARLPAPAG